MAVRTTVTMAVITGVNMAAKRTVLYRNVDFLSKRPKRAPWVKYRRTFSKVQLYDSKSRKFYELNIVGGVIWDCCNGINTVRDIIKEIAEDHQIGSHGTKHDGRLILMEKEEIVERLRKSKKELEHIIEREVKWFRAPLLQYHFKIFQAAKEAGYKFTSTSPTWEPTHPITMSSHGVELSDPIKVSGILEVPVTLPQDHQMLHIIEFPPKRTIEKWIEITNKLNGIAVFLVHPDYELGTDYYKKLVKTLAEREQCALIMNYLELLCEKHCQ